MAETGMPLHLLLKHLERLANDSLSLWNVPENAIARLINVAENATYLVEGAEGFKSILRVHRKDYHSRRAIECELAWIDALRESSAVAVPKYFFGRDGNAVQSAGAKGLDSERHLVMFCFLEGEAPSETDCLVAGFDKLGAIAARTHAHSISWKRPANFQRPTWDIEQFFGPAPTWGNWRGAPQVTSEVRQVLERVEQKICSRLEKFGRGPERYGLIHADMRLANLLVKGDETQLIDFDDCGWSWMLYDFAAGVSFFEDHPELPALKAAWVRGYRTVRSLSDAEEQEIDTFIMLRRMALLAWIGSHIEAPEPQKLAPGFAATTARLGEEWLDNLRI